MDSVDLAVLRRARDWLRDGHAVVLYTVIETWGSAPRPVGSLPVQEGFRSLGTVWRVSDYSTILQALRKHDFDAARPSGWHRPEVEVSWGAYSQVGR